MFRYMTVAKANTQPKRIRAIFSFALCLLFSSPPAIADTSPEANSDTASAPKQYTVNGKPATEAQYNAVSLEEEAIQLQNAGKHSEAIIKLEEALRLDPKLIGARLNLGISYAKAGKNAEAIKQFQQAKDEHPEMSAAWINLAALYQRQGEFEKAVEIYDQFVKRFPNDPQTPKVQKILPELRKVPELKKLLSKISAEQEAQNKTSTNTNNPAKQITKEEERADYLGQIRQPLYCRWPKKAMPIKIFIANGSATIGFKPEYKTMLINAFTEWANESNGSFKYILVNGNDNSDIDCVWTADKSKAADKNELGKTDTNFDITNGIQRARILLTLIDSQGKPLSTETMQRQCLHQIGHALGFQGHSASGNDIMSTFVPEDTHSIVKTLSPQDKASIKMLYK